MKPDGASSMTCELLLTTTIFHILLTNRQLKMNNTEVLDPERLEGKLYDICRAKASFTSKTETFSDRLMEFCNYRMVSFVVMFVLDHRQQ